MSSRVRKILFLGDVVGRPGRRFLKEQLAGYTGPELDPGIDEALLAFMTERKASFPDSNV